MKNGDKINKCLSVLFAVLCILTTHVTGFFMLIFVLSFFVPSETGGIEVGFTYVFFCFAVFAAVLSIVFYGLSDKYSKKINKIANLSKGKPIIRESSGSFGLLKRSKK